MNSSILFASMPNSYFEVCRMGRHTTSAGAGQWSPGIAALQA